MTTPAPNPQPSDPHPAEALLGFTSDAEFESVLEGELVGVIERSAKSKRKEADPRVEALFEEHGIDFDPRLVTHYESQHLTGADWDEIAADRAPLLRYFSISTLRGLEWHEEYYPKLRARGREGQMEEAFLRSLPLTHEMTKDTFLDAISAGRLISNREVYEQSDLTSADFKDAGIGSTTARDRDLGLDRYVFADFGRPNTLRTHRQAEITLVIDPEALQQEGTIITEKDILDCGNWGRNQIWEYIGRMLLPSEFYEAAAIRIPRSRVEEYTDGRSFGTRYNTVYQFAEGQDSDPTNVEAFSFSTWEVKMPSVSMASVQKVVVRDEATYQELLGMDLDIEIVHEPSLRPGSKSNGGNYDVLRIPGRVEQEFRRIQSEDFERRQAAIAELSEDEIEEVFMVFAGGLNEHFSWQVTDETSPADYAIRHPYTMGRYPDLNALTKAAKATIEEGVTSRLETFSGGPASNNRQSRLWSYSGEGNILRPTEEDFVVAKVRRSKADPEVAVITEIDRTNLESLAASEQEGQA
ncbi:MAG: hypothetical protein R3313_00210 [Candidatus Saccharimonadales bacterium]|nr:hypothetical protein [Candidatus Saccharimonadales bacterium]